MIDCQMCGKGARVLVYRWKEYHRVKVQSLICIKCVDAHDLSVKAETK
jgi:hypothetical protein